MSRSLLVASAFLVALTSHSVAQPPAKGAEEGTAVSLRELKGVIDTKDAKELFGGTRFVGFLLTEDAVGKDCILVLARKKGQPPLRLDDLAVAHRNAKEGAARPA